VSRNEWGKISRERFVKQDAHREAAPSALARARQPPFRASP
jgi:hypothetical protein